MKGNLFALLAIAMTPLLLMSGLAMAQGSDDPVDTETASQVRAMVTSTGAQVRMLQLQVAVQERIKMAEALIGEIGKSNGSFDTDGLEGILEELRVLEDDISSVNTSEDTEDVVRQFVDLKYDAIGLVEEFREAARKAFAEGDLQQVRQRVMQESQDAAQETRQRLMQAIRENNAESVQSALQNMNRVNSTLISEIRNGELDQEQIRDQIRQELATMTGEAIEEAARDMKRERIQDSDAAEQAIEQAREQFTERVQERIEDRIDQLRQVAPGRIAELEEMVASIRNATVSSPRLGVTDDE